MNPPKVGVTCAIHHTIRNNKPPPPHLPRPLAAPGGMRYARSIRAAYGLSMSPESAVHRWPGRSGAPPRPGPGRAGRSRWSSISRPLCGPCGPPGTALRSRAGPADPPPPGWPRGPPRPADRRRDRPRRRPADRRALPGAVRRPAGQPAPRPRRPRAARRAAPASTPSARPATRATPAWPPRCGSPTRPCCTTARARSTWSGPAQAGPPRDGVTDVLLGLVGRGRRADRRRPAQGVRAPRPERHPADLDHRLAPAPGRRPGLRAGPGGQARPAPPPWPAGRRRRVQLRRRLG